MVNDYILCTRLIQTITGAHTVHYICDRNCRHHSLGSESVGTAATDYTIISKLRLIPLHVSDHTVPHCSNYSTVITTYSLKVLRSPFLTLPKSKAACLDLPGRSHNWLMLTVPGEHDDRQSFRHFPHIAHSHCRRGTITNVTSVGRNGIADHEWVNLGPDKIIFAVSKLVRFSLLKFGAVPAGF